MNNYEDIHEAETLPPPAPEQRGQFQHWDRARLLECASKGGKAAHAMGRAHQWTVEKAREAGRKGGKAAQAKRRAAQ